jgi:hypothetical protein
MLVPWGWVTLGTKSNIYPGPIQGETSGPTRHPHSDSVLDPPNMMRAHHVSDLGQIRAPHMEGIHVP